MMISVLNSISWREPLWLLLCFQPVIVYLLVMLSRSLRNDHYADPQLLAWAKLSASKTRSKGIIQKLLISLTWISFAIAMAGPRSTEKIFSTEQSTYTNIMVLLDVSRSMSAHDIHPSRLERAKLELYDFIERSERSRVGIILYASKAHLLSPLTSDKDLLRHYISTIDTSILPTRGSDLKSALQFTNRYLGNNDASSQAILLVSDGESTQSEVKHYERTLTQIKENNISVYSLIAGTENGAPLLSDQSGWLTFENQDVISRTKIDLLMNIALRTNGKYSTIETTDQEWQKLYNKGIALLNPVNSSSQKSSDLIIWNEWYPWFLLVGLTCFIIAHINPRTIKYFSYSSVAILAGILLSGFFASNTFASEEYQRAYQAYQQQDFHQAEEKFAKIQGYLARIGQASATYKNKDYPKAAVLFIQASLDAKTEQQRVHALFNLANSYYQLEDYKTAANIYTDVLRYQPTLQQAKVNLEYAKALSKKQENNNSIKSSRSGKGPATASPTPGTDIGKANLTLGTESDAVPYDLSQNSDSILTQQQTDLSAAGLVTQHVDSEDDSKWTYQIRSVDEIASINNSVPSDESIFWQRLFEWEEGFPAPLKEPLNVPGVKPW